MPQDDTTKQQVGNSIGHIVPEGWHTRSETAQLVGKSYDTIRRWADEGIYEPSGQMQAGKLTVHLYSDDDIAAMLVIAKTIKQGRPSKAVA